MSKETPDQLAARLSEVILDGTWIANTNFKTQLSDLSWRQANQKIGTLNTIAALTYHVNYYLAGVLHFFEHDSLEIRDQYSFDMPPINSDEDWESLQKQMWSNTEKLVDCVKDLSEELLDKVFVKKEYGTYRRNIEGIIEHSYYHLGQISLLKKMIKNFNEKQG